MTGCKLASILDYLNAEGCNCHRFCRLIHLRGTCLVSRVTEFLLELGLSRSHFVCIPLLSSFQQSCLLESNSVMMYLWMGSELKAVACTTQTVSFICICVGFQYRTLQCECAQGVLQSVYFYGNMDYSLALPGEGQRQEMAFPWGCTYLRTEGWNIQSLSQNMLTRIDSQPFALSIYHRRHPCYQVHQIKRHIQALNEEKRIEETLDEQFGYKIRQQYFIYKFKRMSGKYSDPRVYQHFVHTYSRVPYLDHQIFNVQNIALRESRKANQRASTAQKGLDRTKEKFQQIQSSINELRGKKEKEATKFVAELQLSQKVCLQKEKQVWSSYNKQQQQRGSNTVKDQLYLQNILKSNSTKAESRLTQVRRWN